jgi:hypothetical protein
LFWIGTSVNISCQNRKKHDGCTLFQIEATILATLMLELSISLAPSVNHCNIVVLSPLAI